LRLLKPCGVWESRPLTYHVNVGSEPKI